MKSKTKRVLSSLAIVGLMLVSSSVYAIRYLGSLTLNPSQTAYTVTVIDQTGDRPNHGEHNWRGQGSASVFPSMSRSNQHASQLLCGCNAPRTMVYATLSLTLGNNTLTERSPTRRCPALPTNTRAHNPRFDKAHFRI